MSAKRCWDYKVLEVLCYEGSTLDRVYIGENENVLEIELMAM